MTFFKYIGAFLLVVQTSFSFAQPSSIAVASNMKEAFTEIVAAFKVSEKFDFKIVYGSSGNLTTQIMNGAPFHLFISADEFFPLELYKNGKTINAGKVYAIGKIALITKKSSGITLSTDREGLIKAISKANKVAVAKPELAPYGKAAIEYMKAEGLWDYAKDKLVYADNISAATMFVATGAADIGFSAASLAQSPEILKQTNAMIPSTHLYSPIQQRMVLLKAAPQEVADLYQFMQSPKAKLILVKYGYYVPN